MVLFLMSTYFTCFFIKLPPLDFVPCSVAATKEHIQQKRIKKEKDADYKIQHQHLYDTPKLCNI